MARYIALLRKSPESDYSVDFPDFPDCVTAGRTLEEAHHMAAEALAGHIAVLREDNEAIPRPSDLDAVMADRDNQDATAVLVTIADPWEAGSRRINVTLPADLIADIDARTNNRSAFLALAARHELAGEAD